MTPSRPHLFGMLAGLFLAASLCFTALIVAGAWTRISVSQVINVTGSAHKNVRSDLAIWHASFATEAPTLLAAHQQLKSDAAKVELFLHAANQGNFVFKPVQVSPIMERVKTSEGEITRQVGYRTTQALEVRSTNVETLPKLAGDSAQLIEQGVSISSDDIDFIYTKAGEAKVEMMAEATKDARSRAEQIAGQGGRTIKELRAARVGIVQINPLYSSATSSEGNNDTSSLEKTITTTVTATFSLK
ncbi:MAG: SIMPL domain-containing protein [Opitutaceae bacterium]